jgi:hypothetical protein
MSRSIRIADIVGAVAGIAFAVLTFLSVASVDPQRGVSDQELQAWWADAGNRNGFVISMYLLLLACPLFLLFIARLRTRLQAADVAGWADTAFASGIVVTAALGVTAVLRGVVAGSVRFGDEPVPGVDTLRFATGLAYAAWDLVILFIVVLVAITTGLALAARALPRWLGWLGVPVVIGCVVFLAIGSAPLSLPLPIIWVVATSVHLLRSPVVVSAIAGAQQPESVSAPA